MTAALWPRELDAGLSHPKLESLKRRNGKRQLGTIGRGNHFTELQLDEAGCLWALVHTGSRCMGPAIRDLHTGGERLRGLTATSAAGRDYLADAEWAVAFARANRARLIASLAAIVERVLGAVPVAESYLDCTHNSVTRESGLWVHRKGAIPAGDMESGVIPGSMGSATFHVLGRGRADALNSCSHGAGRAMSRSEARQRLSERTVTRDMRDVWFEEAATERLLAESPSAYRDISRVMRAQRDLVKVVRRLRPLLNYRAVTG